MVVCNFYAALDAGKLDEALGMLQQLGAMGTGAERDHT
jgi:hypothetical protein